MEAPIIPPPTPTTLIAQAVGRPFISPVLDLLLIGGGLSLAMLVYVSRHPGITPSSPVALLNVLLLFQYAHFAASTVRLYSKPGSTQTLRFLCFGFPVVALA